MSDETGPGPDDLTRSTPADVSPAGEPTQAMKTSVATDSLPDEPTPWYKNPAVVIPSVIGLVLIGLLVVLLVDDDSGDTAVDAEDATSTTESATTDSSDSAGGAQTPAPAPAGQQDPEEPTPNGGNGSDCFDGEECLTDPESTFTDAELDGILEAVRGQYGSAAGDCPGAGGASQVYGETTIEFSGTAEGFVEGFAIWEGNATVPFSYDTSNNSVDFGADVCVGLGE